MATSTIQVTEPLYDYLLAVSLREPEILRKLREETAALPEARMQISPEQGQFMGVLTRLLGVRRYLEIGTFTGYSSLAVALAMPPEGRIVACDVSAPFTAVARRYWQSAGVADRIDLRLAPATETLSKLAVESPGRPFDMAFIDADKETYAAYYEACHGLVRPGGLILLDNILWSGAVADPDDTRETTEMIRAVTRTVHADTRVDTAILPIGDGLLMARLKA